MTTSSIQLGTIREQFPALAEKAFLDAACVSVAPIRATEAIGAFCRRSLLCPERSATDQHIAMDVARARVRPLAAQMLGAREDDIAIVESTTQGLSTIAAALPLEEGDRVALSSLEFMQVAVPWVQLGERGIGVDVIDHQGGVFGVDQVVAALTPRTRVLALSSVQWSHGFRCDLEGIASLCRERGVWLVVDAVQQLGAHPIDVDRVPVDALVAGGHKWLNAPFGAGILYVRDELRARLCPPLAGYLSLATPEGGWGAYFQTPAIHPVRPYDFVDEARALEVGGTANYPGAIGLAASLELFLEVGQATVAAHIRDLTGELIEGLRGQDLRVVSPDDPERRAGIVTFDCGSPEANEACMARLLDAGVLVSVRYTDRIGGVRVSCHLYNDRSDLQRLLEVTGSA